MEKQYKHKQSGRIATLMLNSTYYRIDGDGGPGPIPLWMIEDTQDWEQMPEKKEYTILQYKTKSGRMWYRLTNGRYTLSKEDNGQQGIRSEVLNHTPVIYQVRRESDGVVFTIGDKYTNTITKECGVRIIDAFKLTPTDKNVMMIWVKESNGNYPATLLRDAIPAPTEPTWHITAFSYTDDDTIKFSRDMDGEYACTWTQGQMLGIKPANGIAKTVANGLLKIHSVKATPTSKEIAIGDWITAECTHMKDTSMQVEGFVVNDKNNLLIKTKEFRTHGVGIENCKKVKEPLRDLPVEKAPLFTTDDGVEIHNEHQITWAVSDVWNTPGNRKISEPTDHIYNKEWELHKPPVWHLFSTKAKAQEYMDSKKSPEKPAPLIQVLLTQKDINKLKELLK